MKQNDEVLASARLSIVQTNIAELSVTVNDFQFSPSSDPTPRLGRGLVRLPDPVSRLDADLSACGLRTSAQAKRTDSSTNECAI